jgi:hypothetical protein
MRWRVAIAIALLGIAVIPGVSGAAPPGGGATLRVSVKPATGSPATNFVISFKAEQTTGVIGVAHDTYRITASGPAGGSCQASAAGQAPPTHAGATVRVSLAPAGHRRWCAGTFRGQVWNVVVPPCPTYRACPQLVPLPRMVGKFSFRVRRG